MTILRGLRNRGEMSLQDLANMTGLPRAAIQRDYESHLGRLGLMRIDGKRKITSMGCKIVEDSEK
jgi:DNA-binding IclR family transcriptional regulator